VPICERIRVSLKIPPSSRGFRRERGGRGHAGRARRRVLHGAFHSAPRPGERADPACYPDEAVMYGGLSRSLSAVRRESEWRRLLVRGLSRGRALGCVGWDPGRVGEEKRAIVASGQWPVV